MKFPAYLAGLPLALAVLSPACTKHDPPPAQAIATPSPTPVPVNEEAEASADALRRKTGDAAAAIDAYLKQNQPKLREKFQKLGDKFAKDKEHWRQKLLEERSQLEPQIEALKAKASEADPKIKAEIEKQTAALQGQKDGADKRLAELETATADGWKAFKAKMKAEDAAASPSASPATDLDGEPAASASPSP
jgi:heme oxygenase